MGLTFILFIVGIFALILIVGLLSTSVFNNSKLVMKIQSTKFIKSPWITGIVVFILNFILFSSVMGFFVFARIPFIPLILAVIGTGLSIILWDTMAKAFEGGKVSRIKMALTGSSFYLFLAFLFGYLYINVEPQFDGDDSFMAAMGFFLALFITTVAFINCFIILAKSPKKEMK